MAINLVRNSKVFFTTNIDSSGVIKPSGGTGGAVFTNSNTFEVQVLDGFTFSQATANEVVTLSEAGITPSRGQRAFNTSLAPVSFSFSTYIKPALEGTSPTKVTSGDSLLWNALLSDTAITTPTLISGETGITLDTAGLVTITGTGMTPLPTVGDYIVLSGVASTTSSADQDKYINSAGKVITSTATSITVQLVNHAATAATGSFTSAGLGYSKCAWNESTTTYSQVTSGLSDRNQLQKFGMLFLVDNVMYAVDNASLGQVTIDFGLDAIATAQWTGQATALRQFGTDLTALAGTFGGSGAGVTNTGSGAYQPTSTAGKYITNKISTITLKAVKAIGNSITAGKEYLIPITGGSLTINNNINYITPAILGVVNTPVTYYTGTRAISGSVMAYLRTGSAVESGRLLADLLAEATTTTEPMFSLSMNIGGTTSTNPRVIVDLASISLGIPAIDVQQVVSTTINFTAQGYAPNATVANTAFDLTKASDLAVRYYGVA